MITRPTYQSLRRLISLMALGTSITPEFARNLRKHVWINVAIRASVSLVQSLGTLCLIFR